MQEPSIAEKKSILETFHQFMKRHALVQLRILDITVGMIIPVAGFYFINSISTIDHSNLVPVSVMESIIKALIVTFYIFYVTVVMETIGRKEWGWLALLIIGSTGLQAFPIFALYYFVSYRPFLKGSSAGTSS